MSLVSSRVSLKHSCTIERDANAGSSNARGNPNTPNWQTLATVPCRLSVTAGQEAVDATTTAVVEDMRLIVTSDTDVTERDRINGVTYRGATYAAGVIGIRAVLHHQDHIEIVLVRIS